VSEDKTTTTRPASKGAVDPDEMIATLTVVHHPDMDQVGARRTLPDGATLVLGRSAKTSLPGVFDDEKTSRRHVQISRVGQSLRVEDLDSRNGTFVGGERISETALQLGDVVQVGNIVCLIHSAPRRFTEPRHPTMAGISAGLARVIKDIALVAPRDTAVMIVGETGTGKELVAQAIHDASSRRGKFVPVNCASLTETLLASELFGHTRGAFTGADTTRSGLVETARSGTLFLDEVADASSSLQASLLRLLEAGEYRRVGSDRTLTTDARFIGASQPSIEDAVEEGAFRRDLWTRLARWVIRVPALRERPEDIPLLAQRFVQHYGTTHTRLSPELAALLIRGRWPGNIRELQAICERLVVSAEGAEFLEPHGWLVEELAPPRSAQSGDDWGGAEVNPAAPVKKSRRRAPPTQRPSKEELEALLRRHDGSIRAVAKEIGVVRRTVYRWVESLGIDLETLR